MASNLYQEGLLRIVSRAAGTIDLAADTIKVMLLGTGYTPNKDHQFVSDVVGSELSGTGYTGGFGGSGRKTLASKTFNKSDSTDKFFFDAADSLWTAINAGTIGYAIVFKEITSDAVSPVIACVDVADIVTNGGDVSIAWATTGIFEWAA
jgi:hypothetical protein